MDRFEALSEPPIFKKQKINCSATGSLLDLRVGNNNLVLLSSNETPKGISTQIRFDNITTNEHFEVELPPPARSSISPLNAGAESAEPMRLFLDPTGVHVLLATPPADLLYLQRNAKKIKPITKAKSNVITSVAWNRASTTDSSTGPILVGTDSGFLFSTEITANGENYWKEVWRVHPPGNPITAIAMDEVHLGNNQVYYFVLITTPNRLYELFCDTRAIIGETGGAAVGGSENLFRNMFTACSAQTEAFFEIPMAEPVPIEELEGEELDTFSQSASQSSSGFALINDLHLYYPVYRQPPAHFAWLLTSGVYLARFDFKQAVQSISQSQGTKGSSGKAQRLTLQSRLVSRSRLTPNEKAYEGDQRRVPWTLVSMALTEFHLIMLYSRLQNVQLVAFNIMNEQLIFQDEFPPANGIGSLCWDGIKKVLWSFAGLNVFKFTVSNESRDMWKFHLDRKEFDEALKFCENEQNKIEKVLYQQAKFLYENHEYEHSAIIFSQLSSVPFEKTALMFLELPEKRALRLLLHKKLLHLLATPGSRSAQGSAESVGSGAATGASSQTQQLVWLMWLLELFLNELALLRDRIAASQSSIAPSLTASTQTKTNSAPVPSSAQTNYAQLSAEFCSFIDQPDILKLLKEPALSQSVYSMMKAHGDWENLVKLAHLLKDYEREVDYYIQNEKYEEALKILEEQFDIDSDPARSSSSTRVNPERFAEQLYKYSSVLFKKIPEDTVFSWIKLLKKNASLKPEALLPAIAHTQAIAAQDTKNSNQESRYRQQTLRFLQSVIREMKQNAPRSLHNYLISLYCAPVAGRDKAKDDESVEKHLSSVLPTQSEWSPPGGFPESPDSEGLLGFSTDPMGEFRGGGFGGAHADPANSGEARGIDAQYALRQCLDARLPRSTVRLYMHLHLYDEAIDTALEAENIKLAKDCARNAVQISCYDDQLAKRLWLKIARFLANPKNREGGASESVSGVKEAMEVLGECPSIRIEDLLDVFPDFTTIDHLKDAMSTSLSEYDKHIDSLKEEMIQVEHSIRNLRADGKALRSMHVTVRGESRCEFCRTILLMNPSTGPSRGFYIFSCEHAMHVHCLYKIGRSLIVATLNELFSIGPISGLEPGSVKQTTTSPAAIRVQLAVRELLNPRLAPTSEASRKLNAAPPSPRALAEGIIEELDALLGFSGLGSPFEGGPVDGRDRDRREKQTRERGDLGLAQDSAASLSGANAALAVQGARTLKALLDDLLALDCPLCGELAIDSIDAPLVPLSRSSYEPLRNAWK